MPERQFERETGYNVTMEMIDLLSQLVALDTSSGNKENLEKGFELIGGLLEPLGLKRRDYVDEGIRSTVWTNSQSELEPQILLSAHLDVVPGDANQFEIQKESGKLLGRGVSDMKFAIVSFVNALQNLDKAVLRNPVT